MAAIVYLDVDDEITSAAARLRTLAEDRIALVLPLGSRLATSRINFRLLAREASARKKTLEIVTGDASTRALAASAGLATHTSVAAFEGRPEPGTPPGRGATSAAAGAAAGGVAAATGAAGHGQISSALDHSGDDSPTVVVPVAPAIPALRPPRAATPVPQVGRRQPIRVTNRMAAIALALVAILVISGVAGYQLLPSAAVTLRPAVEKVGPIQLSITAQSGVTQPDPTRLLVPARTFSFDLDVTETFPATGVKVAEVAASGEVTFSSLDTGSSNTIPAGSIVSTKSGVEFRTKDRVTLPPAEIGVIGGNIVVIPSTAKVGVDAVETGVVGNVAADTIVIVPKSENAKRTEVTNAKATTGGAHIETKQVAQADLDAAMASLTDAIKKAFDDKVGAAEGVPAGTTLFPETEVLGKATPSVDPKTLLDTLHDTFDLGLTAKGTVVGVDPSPVSTLAEARLRSSVKDGFTLLEDSIDIQPGTPLVTGSTISFPVTVTGLVSRELDVSALRARIRGLGLPQARTVLREYGTVTIVVWPDWVTAIPTNDDRLSFTITAPAEPSASPKASSVPGASSSPTSVPSP